MPPPPMDNVIRLLSAEYPLLSKMVNAIRIESVSVQGFERASFRVELGRFTPGMPAPEGSEIPTPTPAHFEPAMSTLIQMTPEQYALWGDDDSYVFGIAAEAIGVELAPVAT